MRSNTNHASGAVAVALASLVGALLLIVACTPAVPHTRPGTTVPTYPDPLATVSPYMGLDVTTVAPCPQEDGPALGGPIPCVWDGGTAGNGTYTGARWTLYTERCPVDAVQNPGDVHCVARSDWDGS